MKCYDHVISSEVFEVLDFYSVFHFNALFLKAMIILEEIHRATQILIIRMTWTRSYIGRCYLL